MTDTTKQIDRQALLVLAADAGFSVVGCSFVMPTHSGHITEEIEKFAELLAARATPVSPAQSIDTPEFGQLATAWSIAEMSGEMEPAISAWQALVAHIDAHLQAAPAKPQSEQSFASLHSAIMNLPCARIGQVASALWRAGYNTGHHDARHAAAELVAAAQSDMVERQAYDAMKADRDRYRQALDAASVGVAGEPIYQYRITPTHPWTDCRDLHWPAAQGYETRTLYTAPVPAPATVDIDAIIELVAKEFEGYPKGTRIDADFAAGKVRTFGRKLKGKAAPATKPEAVAPVVQREPVLMAYVATDLDGHADVGMTIEQAKRRAGPSCDTIIALHDISVEFVELEGKAVGKPVLAPVAVAPVAGEGLTERVLEMWANYERMGEVCSFEGQPMIYASNLEELATLAKAERQPQPANCPNGCTGPERGGAGCMAVTGECAMDSTAPAAPSAAQAAGVEKRHSADGPFDWDGALADNTTAGTKWQWGVFGHGKRIAAAATAQDAELIANALNRHGLIATTLSEGVAAPVDLVTLAGFLAQAVQEYPDFDGDNPDEPRPLVDLAKRVEAACNSQTAAQPSADQVRDAALEEAAEICDGLHHKWRWDNEPDSDSGPRSCAAAIRAKRATAGGEKGADRG